MAGTYDPIQTVTLGSAVPTVTFASIPATYTDLILVVSAAIASGLGNLMAQVNSDTATHYGTTALRGDGTSALTGNAHTAAKMYLSGAAVLDTVLGDSEVTAHFMNYANVTTDKAVLSRYINAGQQTGLDICIWLQTAAINRIDLTVDTAVNFGVGSKFTLFGVKAA